MDRRTFISGVMGGVLAAPVAARAQKSVRPIVSVLAVGSAASLSTYLAQFREGLREEGYIDGNNVEIEILSAEGQRDRLPSIAADLVRRQPAVIVATGGSATAPVAKAASSTIPIVFTGGRDPVETGLVASLAHPGGNTTGVVFFSHDLVAKRMELLHELVPSATEIALISDPNAPPARYE